jgi:hypothetical protein
MPQSGGCAADITDFALTANPVHTIAHDLLTAMRGTRNTRRTKRAEISRYKLPHASRRANELDE